MNKHIILSVCFFLLFFILLFSGFAYTSVYHWLVSAWLLVFSALLSMESHFRKKPHLLSLKRYTYSSLILISIIISILIIAVTKNPPKNSMLLAKLILTGFNGFVILLIILKLFFSWHRLNTSFRIIAFAALSVLMLVILFFWL